MAVVFVIQICTKPNGYKNHLHKWIIALDNPEMVFRHENTANAVIGIAKWNLYFYFDICKTPLFLSGINCIISLSGCWFLGYGIFYATKTMLYLKRLLRLPSSK
jgi:hypothetical protein